MINPNGAVGGNSQNVPEAHTPRTRSRFPLHYHFFNTHRFGEYIPHYVADMNKDEDFPIHSSSQLRSYTLDSPLFQNVQRIKDYFLVPMEAILPLNWEKFYDNPVRGDDVLDNVGPSVENFWAKVSPFFSTFLTSLKTVLADSSTTSDKAALATMRFLVLMEYFYSNGSLMSSLGCHGAPYLEVSDQRSIPVVSSSWDKFFDAVCSEIVSNLGNGSFTLLVDGYTYTVVSNPNVLPGRSVIPFRHALQLMRDTPTFNIPVWSGEVTNLVTPLNTLIGGSNWIFNPLVANVPFNTSRLWAYQLSVAHYMSNDHIDFIYSAELFRQLIGYYVTTFNGSSFMSNGFFTRNGVRYQYDYLSGRFCTQVLSLAVSSYSSTLLVQYGSTNTNSILGYLSALFGYRRSLRYLDYFTGSRAQPLAVVGTQSGLNGGIDTSVAVNSNMVSVIDITKSIQAQRFLNSVNRVRHNFEGYLKGIFGGETPAPDYHNPFQLAHTSDVVYGQETENTASNQMSDPIAITTNLRSHSGNFMFDIHTDRPCIAIGITHYDISRVYTKTMERSFLHLNRFDWFNPFMQYIGDQPVYTQELGIKPNSTALSSLSNFAYTLRHMEYKQRYNQAAGGFVENLPGWIFVSSDLRGNQASINPDWIRSVNSEFDRFFVSLSGYSLGSYFHFIVDDYNSCNGSRPMAFAPSIL